MQLGVEGMAALGVGCVHGKDSLRQVVLKSHCDGPVGAVERNLWVAEGNLTSFYPSILEV